MAWTSPVNGMAMQIKPEVGKRYKVTLNDCCITGEFTAALVDIRKGSAESQVDDEYYSVWVFDNGVTLDCHNGLTLDPV